MKSNIKVIVLLMLIVTAFNCSKNDDNQQPATITIPDTNFEQALISLGYDTNGLTGDILKTDAELVTNLNLVGKNISDLQGIEGFTNLEVLNCHENNLESLSLTNNLKLRELTCSLNQLTSLDVSSNLLLEELNCGANQLTSLNLSNNIELTKIVCAVNQLHSLNIKSGNNTNISIFSAINNPNLECIKVDNTVYSNSNWTNIDAITSFDESCEAS